MMTTTPPTTTTTPTTTTSSLLWYTDRSRFKLGTSRCARARYLGYHAFNSYGITARRDALPLVTGIAVHQILEDFTSVLRQYDRLPALDEVRAIITAQVDAYVTRVEARGYRGILGGPDTEETIAEQAALIAGLGWALRLQFLPWLHQGYKVVAVEQERLHFLDCSCGAPPLDADEHHRRSCSGKAIMLRTDLLAQRRGASTLAYFECKTTGWDNDAWAEQWETDAQLALGTVDAEKLWGAEVTELYIVGLSKGRRQRDRYAGSEDPRKKQLSPLCYGYLRPGNPPLATDDWLPSHEWVNEQGETKRASRAHRRTGVWTLDRSDWPTWRAYQASNPGLTPVEFWVRNLPAAILDKVCFILGPMNRQDAQLRGLLGGFRGEERRWQETLWALYELQTQGHTWASETFQAALDELVPCSWACRPFGTEHQCEFVPICHRHEGWADPLGSGHYQPRLPHHDPELDQAIGRGLLPAEAANTDEED
jgi:hypothetical protein